VAANAVVSVSCRCTRQHASGVYLRMRTKERASGGYIHAYMIILHVLDFSGRGGAERRIDSELDCGLDWIDYMIALRRV